MAEGLEKHGSRCNSIPFSPSISNLPCRVSGSHGVGRCGSRFRDSSRASASWWAAWLPLGCCCGIAVGAYWSLVCSRSNEVLVLCWGTALGLHLGRCRIQGLALCLGCLPLLSVPVLVCFYPPFGSRSYKFGDDAVIAARKLPSALVPVEARLESLNLNRFPVTTAVPVLLFVQDRDTAG